MQKKYLTCSQEFQKKVKGVRSNDIGLYGYQASYFDHLISHLPYYLKIYNHTFYNAAKIVNKNFSGLVLLDYGCGVGLLGLYAKFCRFKKVLLCDIVAENIIAAKKISEYLKISIDEFIIGDIDTVKEKCIKQNIIPDIVIGTDVIEHIYNLDHFFKTLNEINPLQINIFSTASNPDNTFKLKKIKQQQHRDEYTGGYQTHINNYVDEQEFEESFFEIRKKIIKIIWFDVRDDAAHNLAQNLRGKNKADIEFAIQKFKRDGVMPLLPADIGSNTCDPITGSWTERVLPLSTYKKIYNDAGFHLKIKNGFYNDYNGSVLKKMAAKLINYIIVLFGGSSKIISPFIELIGSSKKGVNKTDN